MNKIIGIIGAMDIEVCGLISAMQNKKEEECSGITFVKGTLCGKEVVISKCGIGKVFAALCAQTMILKYDPAFIINSGVAGALSDQLNILDAVIATGVVQHDMDTSPLGDPKGLISGINVIKIGTDIDISNKLERAVTSTNVRAVRGIIASGDQFIADSNRKKEILTLFNAIACEMEGASIGQVCYVNKIPFAVLRTISDGKGEALDYMTFSLCAANKSIDIIKNFIMNY